MAAGDKRRFARVDSLNFVAEEGRMMKTLDLSREGVLLEMTFSPPVGTDLDLTIALGEVLIKCKGKVMRHIDLGEGRTGIGVQFQRMTQTASNLITDYLREQAIKAKQAESPE